jgi:hypothetical protein
MLKTHGRYDYSAISKRPDYSFPGGARLASKLPPKLNGTKAGRRWAGSRRRRCRRVLCRAVKSEPQNQSGTAKDAKDAKESFWNG